MALDADLTEAYNNHIRMDLGIGSGSTPLVSSGVIRFMRGLTIREELMYMLEYGSKITLLTRLVSAHVTFKSIKHAEDVATYHTRAMSSAIGQDVYLQAENLLNRQEEFGLTEVLATIGTRRATKLSALREAIMMNAINYFVAASADKVMSIVQIIEPLMPFDDAAHAKEYAEWDADPQAGDVVLAVNQLSEALLDREDELDLGWVLATFGNTQQVKLSALREAIKRCGERFMLRPQLEELAELAEVCDKGRPNQRAMAATA